MANCCSIGIWTQRKTTGAVHHLTVPCRRWACPSCRKMLIESWCDHLRKCTRSLNVVYRTTVEEDEWEAVYSRLRRQNARYFSIRLSETRRAVYSEAPTKHATCEALDPESASQRFHRELSDYDHRRCKHPVSTCRNWRRPSIEPKYERIPDVKPVRATTVRRVAEELEVELKPWSGDTVDGLQVEASEALATSLIKQSSLADRRKQSFKPKVLHRQIPSQAPVRSVVALGSSP